MAATLAALAGAPVEVKIGGTVYRMSPLRLRDQAEYERFLQEHLCKLAGAVTADSKSLASIVGELSSTGFFSDEASKWVRTVDGAARLIWLGVRRNHPDMKFDALLDTMSDEEITDGVQAFNRVNRGEPTPPKADAPPAARST